MDRPPLVDHLLSVERLESNIGVDLGRLSYKPRYELGSAYFEIWDPVWEHEHIGAGPYDQILVDLAHTDAMRRLQTIEQLTLPERYSTIPDAFYFSRWEHAWGSLVLIRRMTADMQLEPKDAMYLQLKVLLSDFKHTAFSHAGDWLLEGEGGPEKAHENRRDYADIVKVSWLLRSYGFSPERVFDDTTEDITDIKKPHIDGDGVDYILREAFRWADQSPVLREALGKDSFKVVNGRIAAVNVIAAKMLTVSHAILVSQYWHDPVERLQLNLLFESLKRIFVCSNGHHNEWGSYSPRDLLNTADNVLLSQMMRDDEFTHLLDAEMSAVAQSERTIHWRHRRDHVRFLLEKAVGRNPERVDWVTNYYDVLPSSVEIIEDKPGSRMRSGKRMVVFPLKKHRRRYIDPLFINNDGEVEQLGQADPSFMAWIGELLEPTRLDWQGALVQNVATTSMLRRCIAENRNLWPEVMARPPLSSDAIRMLLRQTVHASAGYASRFVEFSNRH